VKTQNSIQGRRPPVAVVLTLAVALFPVVLFAQGASGTPRRDFQAWTSFRATHQLRKKIGFFIGAGLRYGNDQGHLSYRRVTTGFAFHWHRILNVQPYYQYSISDSFSGPLKPENRLALATIVVVPWNLWRLSDRNLGERRFLVNGRTWRYRNRVEFRRPFEINREQLSVFAWDEVYYSSKARRWYRNRFALGMGRRLTGDISIDVFYVHQNDDISHPGDLNGVGMTLRTRF
jgi:Protein of unknown function (DUF2490)